MLQSPPCVEAVGSTPYFEKKACTNGCVRKVGGVFVGVLAMTALLFGVYTRAPDSWKHPNATERQSKRKLSPMSDGLGNDGSCITVRPMLKGTVPISLPKVPEHRVSYNSTSQGP